MHCFTVTPCGCTRLIVWVCLPHVKTSQEQSNRNMKLLYFYISIISYLSFLPLKDMKNLQGNKLGDTRTKGWRTHMGQQTEEASANWKAGDPAGSRKKNKFFSLDLGKECLGNLIVLFQVMLLSWSNRQRDFQPCWWNTEGSRRKLISDMPFTHKGLGASNRLSVAISKGEVFVWPLWWSSSWASTEPHCSCISSAGAARERWMGNATQTQLVLAALVISWLRFQCWLCAWRKPYAIQQG